MRRRNERSVADVDGPQSGIHAAGRQITGLEYKLARRDPADRGWEEWTRAASHQVVEVQGIGTVENWVELTNVNLPLVSFRGTYIFADGQVLTSDSTLRFRERTS